MRSRAWRRACNRKHKRRNLMACRDIFPDVTGSPDDIREYLRNDTGFARGFVAGMHSPFTRNKMSEKEPYLKFKNERRMPLEDNNE